MATALTVLLAGATLVAGGIPTAVAAPQGSRFAPYSSLFHGEVGGVDSVACLSRTTCFAIARVDGDTRSAVVRFTDHGKAARTHLLAGGSLATGMSCVSGNGCVVMGNTSSGEVFLSRLTSAGEPHLTLTEPACILVARQTATSST